MWPISRAPLPPPPLMPSHMFLGSSPFAATSSFGARCCVSAGAEDPGPLVGPGLHATTAITARATNESSRCIEYSFTRTLSTKRSFVTRGCLLLEPLHEVLSRFCHLRRHDHLAIRLIGVADEVILMIVLCRVELG